MGASFTFSYRLSRGFREPALVPCRCVLVDQPLPRCAIEKLHSSQLFLGVATGGRTL